MILRTELRRSSAPVIGIGFAVVTIAAIYGLTGPWHKGSAPWNEEWIGLAQWTRNLMLFLWPLVLGAGAWQGLRDKRSRVAELLTTTPRPTWQRVLPLLGAVVLALLAGYLVVLVVGGVQVAAQATYFSTASLPVVGVLMLALAGSVLLGVGLGRLVPSLLTPPVVAILALAGQIAVMRSGWPMWLTPAFDGLDITVFTAVAPEVSLVQAVWFLGIGATGFGLVVAARARHRLAALLPVAVAAGVAVPVLSGVDSVAVADDGARELVCDGNVCVTRAHESYLPVVREPALSALAWLRTLPDAPTSVVEMVPHEDYRPPTKAVPLFINLDVDRYPDHFRTDPADIERTLLGNALVPACRAAGRLGWEASVENAVARAVAVGWVTGASGPAVDDPDVWGDEYERFEQAWQAFASLPQDEQHDRVIALRAAAVDCQPDLLSIVERP